MIKIVLSTDVPGFAHNATVLASVLRRTTSPVHVRVYTRGFSYGGFEAGRLKAEFIRCDEDVTGNYPGHVNEAVFDRLRAIRDFDDWDRALVLDHDMLVFTDLADYFAEPFEGSLLMGRLFGPGNTLGLQVSGRGTLPRAWEHCASFPYFYMGPMMNLEAMRREGFWERLLEAHAAIGLDEQISLTAASGGRIKGVDKKWNLIPAWDKFPDIAPSPGDSGDTPVEVDGIRWSNGLPDGIVHWNGPAKPWHYRSKVWRADLWESETCGWEVLRAGRWDKPVSVEVEPSDMGRVRSLLRRGWKVRVCPANASAGSGHLPDEAYPDLEIRGSLPGPSEFGTADMIRFGPFAELQETLPLLQDLPPKIVIEGPRRCEDVAKLRDSGFQYEARVVRRDWPNGGPHPKVLGYADPRIPAAVPAGEDLYLSRELSGHPPEGGMPSSSDGEGATRKGDPEFETFIRTRLPRILPAAGVILEFGPGAHTRALAETFPKARITAVEHDSSHYRRLRFDFSDSPMVAVHHAPMDPILSWYDLSEVPLEECDVILLGELLEIPGSLPQKPALSVADLVRPGGVVILSGGNGRKEADEFAEWTDAGFALLEQGDSFAALRRPLWASRRTAVERWRNPVDLASLARKTYVISLPERADRLAGLRKNWQATSMPLDFEVVDGIRPAPEDIRWHEMKGMEGYGMPGILRGDYVVGAVGCKRAGIQALRSFIDSGAGSALICQDDCRWIPGARESVAKALAQLPDDWDMVYFSASARAPHEPFSPRLIRLTGARLCTAILWKRSTALEVLPKLEACDCEMDFLMQKLHPEMKAFCVFPMPAYQARSFSDISGKVAMPPNR